MTIHTRLDEHKTRFALEHTQAHAKGRSRCYGVIAYMIWLFIKGKKDGTHEDPETVLTVAELKSKRPV